MRRAAWIAQGFALFGTLAGLLTIAVGVGLRSAPDVGYHLGSTAVLIWGLTVAGANASPETTR